MSTKPSSEETPDLQGAFLLTLAIMLGVWLLVFGAMETGLAVRAMSVRHRTRTHAVHAT
jgi:hypothetical protein